MSNQVYNLTSDSKIMKRIPRLPCYTHELLPVVSDGLNEMNCGVDADEMKK
jgi:hypothetical protein